MQITPKNINRFLLFKLPSAFLCGVRAKSLTDGICTVTVKHRWINQNPFRSMYFAVQSMAAELSTGALVLSKIKTSGAEISMLVIANKASYSKKATGRITFTCRDGKLVSQTVSNAINFGEGQTVTLKSKGVNDIGETVSEMEFTWTLKVKPPR